MFEVGQKIKIIDAKSMGMRTYRNGEIYFVGSVDEYGDALLSVAEGLTVTSEWIEAGYAEIVK